VNGLKGCSVPEFNAVNTPVLIVRMSLAPKWYSTIYSVNMFGGAMIGTYAFLGLLSRAIQQSGRLTRSITVEHYHDIGKLLFGFTFFWAYTAFSQFMLIWYANIPEEVVFYRYRMFTDWQALSIVVILCCWAIPYVLLLSRWTKRILPVFMILCAWQLIFHFIDLYWNVMPNLVWGAQSHDGHTVVTGPLTGALAWSSRIFPPPLPSAPIGSGGLMSTLWFFNVASPRWTLSANFLTSSHSASSMRSSLTVAICSPCT
jgi:hypothetical protein